MTAPTKGRRVAEAIADYVYGASWEKPRATTSEMSQVESDAYEALVAAIDRALTFEAAPNDEGGGLK